MGAEGGGRGRGAADPGGAVCHRAAARAEHGAAPAPAGCPAAVAGEPARAARVPAVPAAGGGVLLRVRLGVGPPLRAAQSRLQHAWLHRESGGSAGESAERERERQRQTDRQTELKMKLEKFNTEE